MKRVRQTLKLLPSLAMDCRLPPAQVAHGHPAGVMPESR